MRREWKRFLAGLTGLVVMLTMVSCSSGNGDDVEEATNSTTEITATPNEKTSDAETKVELPNVELKNKVLRVLTLNPENEEKTEKNLKKFYDIDIQGIQVTWFEFPQKLSALVMSGQSPDLTLCRWGDFDYPSYIVNDLVQPINDFTDLNHQFYDGVKGMMDTLTWKDGKNYLMVSGANIATCTIYNKKTIEDAGLDDPWELYKNNEWTWDKLKEFAEELYNDSNGDGVPESWGALIGPSFLPYTTGVPFGEFKDGKFVNNTLHSDIVRCMNFMYDMFSVKKLVTWDANPVSMIKDGKAAIVVGDFVPVMSADLKEMNRAGEIGIVPVPRDPEKDKYYTWCYVPCYFIPKGAQNPNAAIAFWNYSLLEKYHSDMLSEEDKAQYEERRNKQYDDWGFTDDLITQYQEALNENKGNQVHEIVPVIDMAAWIGMNSTVNNCVFGNKSWTKAVEEDRPVIESWIKKYIEK